MENEKKKVISQRMDPKRRLQKCFGQFLRHVGEIFEEEDEINQSFYEEFQNCTLCFQHLSLMPQDPKTDKIASALLDQEENKGILEKKTTEDQQTKLTVQLNYIFEDFAGTLAEALDLLNIEAEELGYKFKMGPFSNKDQNRNSYAYIYCKERFRYSNMPVENSKYSQKKSKSKYLQERCMASSGFKLKAIKDGKKIFIYHSENPQHTHGPKVYQEITQAMISQMLLFRRKRPISDIVSFLEHKNGTYLNYRELNYRA